MAKAEEGAVVSWPELELRTQEVWDEASLLPSTPEFMVTEEGIVSCAMFYPQYLI